MSKLLKSAAIAVAVLAFGSLNASASTLSIVGGSVDQLESTFDLTSVTGLANDGTVDVTVFDSSNSSAEGLFIAADANVTYTFLGKEAGFINWSFSDLTGTNETFSTDTASIGDNETVPYSSTIANTPDLLPFSFASNQGTPSLLDDLLAANGDITNPLYMAFYEISAQMVIAFFGDGTGDRDFDDMVILITTNGQTTAVPLPAPLLLLLSGLFGLGFLGRFRSKAAVAA